MVRIAHWWAIVVAVLIGLTAAAPLAREGYYQGHDGIAHLFRVAALAEDLQRGLIYPRWSPDLALGYGYPVFHFYGPASHYLAWMAHQLGASLPDAVKLTYAGALIAAAIGMVVFLRAALPSVGGAGALVAAGMYTLAPYVLADIYTRGAFGEAVSLAAYPYILWGVRRVVRSGGWSGVAVASVATALAIVTYNPLALVGLPLVGLYALWLAPRDGCAIWRAIGAVALGLALAAWFWLPALVDSSIVTIGNLGYARENFLAPAQLIQPSLDYRHEQFPFAIGLVQAIVITLGAVGVARLPRAERREARFFLIATALVAIAMTTLVAPLWEMVPLLTLIAYPWRLLAFVALFGAVAAAGLVTFAPTRWRSALRIGLALATLGLVVWSSLSETLPEPIPAQARDVTPATWLRREATTGVIGTTTGAEYLPKWSAAGPGAAAETPRGSEAPTIRAARLESVRGLDLTLAITTTAPTDLRLHSFHFPGWTATVNGQSAPVSPTTPLGLVTVAVPPGEHRVALSFGPTIVTYVGGAITMVGALIVVAVIAAPRRHRIALGTLTAFAMGTVAATGGPHAGPMITAVGAEAQPGLILLGATLAPRADDLALRLYWLPTRPLARDLPLTVELVDAEERVVARRVGPPRYGVELLTDWRANEIVIDAIWLRLPTPRAAGLYRARVGFDDRLFDVGSVSLGASRAAPPPRIDPPLAAFGDQVAITAVTVDTGVRATALPRAALVAPAQELRVDLTWQALRTPDDDYIAFMHLYGADGRRWAHLDHRPAGNLSAMTTWQVGDTIRDRRRFVIPLDIPAGAYRLEVGVYTPGGGPRVPTAFGTTTVELARLLVVRPVAPPRVAIDAAFANGAHLVGLDRTADGIRLVWRADAPIARASTVFVHALDDHGAIIGQADGVPASGAWPTDAWPVGAPIDDYRALPVASWLRVGLYDPATGERVATRDGSDAVEIRLAP